MRKSLRWQKEKVREVKRKSETTAENTFVKKPKIDEVTPSDEVSVKIYSSNNKEATENTFEQCEYTCGICKEKFQVHNALWTHVDNDHKDITLRDYKNKYGLCRTNIVKHRCRICEKEILHTKTSISQHLWLHSPVTLVEYKDKYLYDSEVIDG